jgi:hypothetical protein
MDRLSRRSFIHASAGVASGAVIAGTPAVLVLDRSGAGEAPEPAGVAVAPSAPIPREPVMAYVRDAERGEVTVVSGTTETTYHDPALVKRMLDAVPAGEAGVIGGELGVIAP